MAQIARNKGFAVNEKRIGRLMKLMGMEAIYPKKKLSEKNPEHKIYPYLLRDVEIKAPDQVWSTDITYIPIHGGFLYLTAVIDWFSRYVLSWELSNTLDQVFCVEALNEALRESKPEIFNTDQGSQFTSQAFTGRLEMEGVQISMDGRGRALDNIFMERLWRTVKYEDIYLNNYENAKELHAGMSQYFKYYNTRRMHQSLKYRTPIEVYRGEVKPGKNG